MRLFGHPVHTMLLHFPVALWPAHGVLHLFASRLPAGVSACAGFWILVAGTAAGWAAAACGALDLVAIAGEGDRRRLNAGLLHGAVNGAVLLGFTGLLAAEYPHYPAIVHGGGFLAVEWALLTAMIAGNYLGSSLVWGRPRGIRAPDQA